MFSVNATQGSFKGGIREFRSFYTVPIAKIGVDIYIIRTLVAGRDIRFQKKIERQVEHFAQMRKCSESVKKLAGWCMPTPLRTHALLPGRLSAARHLRVVEPTAIPATSVFLNVTAPPRLRRKRLCWERNLNLSITRVQ